MLTLILNFFFFCCCHSQQPTKKERRWFIAENAIVTERSGKTMNWRHGRQRPPPCLDSTVSDSHWTHTPSVGSAQWNYVEGGILGGAHRKWCDEQCMQKQRESGGHSAPRTVLEKPSRWAGQRRPAVSRGASASLVDRFHCCFTLSAKKLIFFF